MKTAYPPFFLRVSKAVQQAWVQHFRDVGFDVVHVKATPIRQSQLQCRWRAETWAAPDCPLYGPNSCIAKSNSEYPDGVEQYVHYIVLRLPDAAKAFKRRHVKPEVKKGKQCPKR